jgi:hypothetical protein
MKMKAAWTILSILLLIFGTLAYVYGNLYPNKGVWIEGTVTDPLGETSYFGGNGTQTLTGSTFGTGETQSYALPHLGRTGLYAHSENPISTQRTYVQVLSRYYDTFTFYPYTPTQPNQPTTIKIYISMAGNFISPTGAMYGSKAGEFGFNIILNPDGSQSHTIHQFVNQNATDGGWDAPVYPSHAVSIPGGDLGYWLWHYCGVGDGKFVFGDQVTLALEYYTWAKDGATVNCLYTGNFKFALSDADKAAGAFLIVTSPSGYYQTDGVVRRPLPWLMLLLD